MTRVPAVSTEPQAPPTPSPRSGAWTAFQSALADALEVLDENQYLVINHPASHGFVQFAGEGADGLLAEVRSNKCIEDEKHKLGPEQECRLIELGWQPPTRELEDKGSSEGSPNWYRRYRHPVPWREVAQVAVMTLREVYDVSRPRFLRYNAFVRAGERILIPGLRIRPDSRGTPRMVHARDRAHLEQLVLGASRRLLDSYFLHRVGNGELVARDNDTIIVIRCNSDPLGVRVYSRVIEDSSHVEDALEVVNRYNQVLRGGRVTHEQGGIWVDWLLPADPFVPEHLMDAVGMIHAVTEIIRRELTEAPTE